MRTLPNALVWSRVVLEIHRAVVAFSGIGLLCFDLLNREMHFGSPGSKKLKRKGESLQSAREKLDLVPSEKRAHFPSPLLGDTICEKMGRCDLKHSFSWPSAIL